MTLKRQVFYSFHYKPDCTRVARVRNIGAIEGNKPATDNDWETVVGGGDPAIEKWIDGQLKNRSCAIILAGSETADRKWINKEIVKSWNSGMGVVGIYIHGLKNLQGETSSKGKNPFNFIRYGDGSKKLSEIVKCYNPAGTDSKSRYGWISRNLSTIVEDAIAIRKKN